LSKFTSVADSRCFNPDPYPKIFSIPDKNIFHLGSYIKREMKNKNYCLFSCSLRFQEQVLIGKKIPVPVIHPGSELRKILSRIRIPDTGGKKAPDPGPRIRNTGFH
jgi:hypothetical protein